MRRRRVLLVMIVAAVPLVAFACNGLTGVSDLGTGPCEGCGSTDSPVGQTDAPATGDATEDGRDAASSSDVFARPTYCTGIVMYLRLDGTLTTSKGIAPELPPVTPFVPGKFGSAAIVAGDAGAIFYVNGPGGVAYSKTEGTIAMWFKPQWTWPSAVDRIIWKPVGDRSTLANQAGPQIRAYTSTFFGTANTYPDGGTIDVGTTAAALTPYWKDGDFNHLAETWSQTSPTLTFTLNGGAGDMAVTHSESDAAWIPQFPNPVYTRLASNLTPADGVYDDVAMWNRALSLAELQMVYAAKQPIGDVCGL